MRIIKAGYEIMDPLNGEEILRKIERCGRVCYKSEEKTTKDSARQFVMNILSRGHESVVEHVSFSVRFICDRGISHEIVRHRIASFSQESTRYCNYGNSGEVTFIEPLMFEKNTGAYRNWENGMRSMENHYLGLLNGGCTPQEARSVLPNSLKTEIIMTANLREWRHFLRLRTGKGAHPQMREITVPLLKELQSLIPIVFDDIQDQDCL